MESDMQICRAWMMSLLLAGILVGCSDEQKRQLGLDDSSGRGQSDEPIVLPEDIKGTVGEKVALVSAGDAPISGWGIVIGLGQKGSSEVPPALRNDLVKYLKSEIHIGRATFGTGHVSVDDFLEDPDTAIVRLDAVIPPGAPKGTPIDVVVSAWPGTQTVSLEGGLLLPKEMHWDRGSSAGGRYLRPLGKASGAVFINPFLEADKPGDVARYRQGRILGGARILEDMPIRLQLHQPDYMTSQVIQRRINFRFRKRRGDVGSHRRSRAEDVASAKTRYFVDLTIPDDWREDYEHFLNLVLHLPMRSDPGSFAATANRIAQAIERPTANHNGLALVWEAMGRQVIPIVQKLYASDNPAVAYFAARTGYRLGDIHLAGPVVLRYATTARGPFQIQAIEELGKERQFLQAGPALKKMLDDPNELVRIAAYEALLERGDESIITRTVVDPGQTSESRPSFILDQVESSGRFVIYATRTMQPKLVLFGKNMPLAEPLFFTAADELVTVFSKQGDEDHKDPAAHEPHMVVYRRLPGSSEVSRPFRISNRLADLVRVLGGRPRPHPVTGEVEGLGLTYSQVVGVLHRMCKEKSIPANFVLQPLAELQKIYRDTPSVGRPDRPDR
jgi:hypothetical protein